MTAIGADRNVHSGVIYCALLYLWSGQLNAGSHKQPAVLVSYTKPLVSWNSRKQHINTCAIIQEQISPKTSQTTNNQTHIIQKTPLLFCIPWTERSVSWVHTEQGAPLRQQCDCVITTTHSLNPLRTFHVLCRYKGHRNTAGGNGSMKQKEKKDYCTS